MITRFDIGQQVLFLYGNEFISGIIYTIEIMKDRRILYTIEWDAPGAGAEWSRTSGIPEHNIRSIEDKRPRIPSHPYR